MCFRQFTGNVPARPPVVGHGAVHILSDPFPGQPAFQQVSQMRGGKSQHPQQVVINVVPPLQRSQIGDRRADGALRLLIKPQHRILHQLPERFPVGQMVYPRIECDRVSARPAFLAVPLVVLGVEVQVVMPGMTERAVAFHFHAVEGFWVQFDPAAMRHRQNGDFHIVRHRVTCLSVGRGFMRLCLPVAGRVPKIPSHKAARLAQRGRGRFVRWVWGFRQRFRCRR